MSKLPTKARPRARTLLLAGVAVGALSAVGLVQAAFAAGGNGGQDIIFDQPETGTGGQGYSGKPGGSVTGASGTDAPSDTGGGGGGGAGGGAGGSVGGLFPAAGGSGGTTPDNPNGGNGASNTQLFGGGGGGGGAHGDTVDTLNNPNGAVLNGGSGGRGGNGDTAGGGGGGGAGGYGAVVTGSNASLNSGTINGGSGGAGGNGGSNQGFASNGGGGGDGGIGVLLTGTGASLTNTGTIAGAAGGMGGASGGGDRSSAAGPTNQPGASGLGGAGVSFLGANGTLTNRDLGSPGFNTGIFGGQGGRGALNANGANGGNAVEFLGANGTFINTLSGNGAPSTVVGGQGGANNANGGLGGTGGNGVFFANGGSVNNQADTSITGGQGGDAGVAILFGRSTSGTSGLGGDGVAGSGLTITNAGTLTGGRGGSGSFGDFGKGVGNGGQGGVGIGGSNLAITNAGTGTISGGNGGDAGFAFTGTPFSGGNGGVGILADNTTITNAGIIQGGNGGGGTNGGANGVGGIGIVGSNLTIDNTGGSISGGFAGTAIEGGGINILRRLALAAAPPPGGPQAYAIQFNGGTNYVGTGGTINGGIYVGAGSFQPALNGTAPGTPLTVNGPINFAPGSFYNVRIMPTAGDSAVANTSAAGAPGISTVTGASVNAIFGNGTYQARQYTILTAAAGVVGTFAGLSFNQNFAFLTPTLSYDPNHVYLNITVSNPIVVTNPTTGQPVTVPNYRTAAITYNQINVAGGLTQAGIRNLGQGPILTALNQLSAPQARAAFDNLSGEGITGAQNVAFRSTQLFTSSIFDQTTFYTGAANSITLCDDPLYRRTLAGTATRNSCEPVRELADLPTNRFQPGPAVAPNRTWRAWATGWGGTEHLSGNAFPTGSATQNNDIYGGTLGIDYQVLPNYLAGVAIGGSNGDFRVNQRATSGSTTGGHVAFYDLLTLGNWYGASSTSFSYFGNKTTRFVQGFGGLGSETERGNFDSHEYRTRLEFGRHLPTLPAFGGLPALAGLGSVTPFVALEIAELRSNGFTEYTTRGAGNFRLNVSGQTIGSVPGFLGLRFQRVAPVGNGMIFAPVLQLAYVHEFAPYRNQFGTLAALPGSTFLVDGARPARDAAQVKAGGELTLGPHSAIFANFDGEFSGINQLYAGKGGFCYTW